MPCPVPRRTRTGAHVGCFPVPRGLPRITGGSASATSLSRPAQASLELRPVGSLNRPRRPLSQGFDPSGYPDKPPASYQIKPTTVWVVPSSTSDTRLLGAPRRRVGSLILATRIRAVAEAMVFSQSLASLRQRFSQVEVRSTTHPSPGQNFEALGGIGSCDDLKCPVANIFQGSLEFRSSIGGIGEDVAPVEEAVAEGLKHLGRAVPVLYAGRVHDQANQQTEGVGDDVALALLDLLARVIAPCNQLAAVAPVEMWSRREAACPSYPQAVRHDRLPPVCDQRAPSAASRCCRRPSRR